MPTSRPDLVSLPRLTTPTENTFIVVQDSAVNQYLTVADARVLLYVPVGYSGSRGQLGATGFTGSTGTQGVVGFVGSRGAFDAVGFTGSRGITGYTGSTGTQGQVGFVGSQGITGYTGSTGTQGITGYTGSTGTQGQVGFVGSQGVVGFVGSRGNDGTSVSIKGSTSTYTLLPGYPSSYSGSPWVGSIGDGYITIDTGHLWIWNGSWQDAGNITGPKGDTGYTGSQGVVGFVGSQGIVGFVGSTGTQGQVGFVGSTGTQGQVGFVGSQGLLGYTGSTGTQGITGFTGSTGTQGQVGFVGSTGTQGTTGFTGSTGTQGVTGFTGSTGTQGVTGFVGSVGAGISGISSTGTTGPFTISNTTNASSTTTGALIVVGGVGVGGTVYLGGYLQVGTTSTTTGNNGEIRATNEITAYFGSDIRLKENIQLIDNPITLINQIRGVRFDWTEDYIQGRGGLDGYFVRKHDIGVIAQEIESILPEIVATRDDGFKAVKYEKIVPLLIESIKELHREIEILKKKIQ